MLAASTGLQTAVAVGTLVIAMPALAAIAFFIARIWKRVHVVHEAVVGRPKSPGVEPIPSMVERFQGVSDHLKKQDEKIEAVDGRLRVVEGEFEPNHGSTLRDKVDLLISTLVETQVPPKGAAG